MAILRSNEIREMSRKTREEKIQELKRELNQELSLVAAGGRASNPGRIREIRRTIARILTINREQDSLEESPKSKDGGEK
ncbi:MAG: 50S ribosomal protein L29 [Candidatus Micrarchaeia archaeon]